MNKDKTKRSDEWRINQFNRNRSREDQVSTIEEMEKKVKEMFKFIKILFPIHSYLSFTFLISAFVSIFSTANLNVRPITIKDNILRSLMKNLLCSSSCMPQDLN